MSITFKAINFPGANWTQANGISRSGPLGRSVQIVGTYADTSGTHGFLLSEGHFTTLDVPDGHNTAAYGINGSGQIVGTYEYEATMPGVTRGFIFESGTYTTFTKCELGNIVATYGTNNSGFVVGSFKDLNTYDINGFSYLTEPYSRCINYPPPPGSKIELFGVNNVGNGVGYVQGPESQGYIDHGVFLPNLQDLPSSHTLDVPGATRTTCRGINDAGVICGYAQFDNEFAAFVASNGTFTIFGFPGASWTQAHGINDPIPNLADTSFDVVGLYTDQALLQSHGFVATLSPPHVVKWDGRTWAELELEAGAVIRQEGRVLPDSPLGSESGS